MLNKKIVEKNINDIIPYENNPRHNDSAIDAVANSIKEFHFQNPIIIDKDNVIIAGHTRLKAAQKLGLEKVPCIVADDLTEEQVKAFRLADNKTAELAEWDFEKLERELLELKDFDMEKFGFEELEEKSPYDIPNSEKGSLNDKFIVPPFSVLDTRQGYWQERKRIWKDKIQDDGSARGDAEIIANITGNYSNVSLLDPVLCEVVVKWFMPKNGVSAFDCFAGDTVFGFVSSSLGVNFTGVELRQEQVDFNQNQINKNGLSAKYICDDGRNVLKHIKENSQDLFFSCPPYFDLEIYSNLENDASNQKTYEEFYAILDDAFTNAIKCLKSDRFAVVVVGDVRNKKTGEYYGFMEDVKKTFKRNGLKLYNELILVDVAGTAAIRASKNMKTRKCTKVHQNVLVFYKGDTKNIKDNFETIEYKEGDLIESKNA